jgi:hypothetical protein
VLHVFFSTKMSDLKEETHLAVHRVFVFVLGFSTAMAICRVNKVLWPDSEVITLGELG